MDILIKVAAFVFGLVIVVMTIFSALSTFVLTRAARSQLNRLVFGNRATFIWSAEGRDMRRAENAALDAAEAHA